MVSSLSYRDVLRTPGVSRLLVAAALTRLAGRTFVISIVFYALARFQSPLLAGWIAFWSMAPGTIVSPIAGAVLDRIGAPKAILLDLVASALALTAIPVADFMGLLQPVSLGVVVAIYSLSTPLSFSGIRVLLPRLVASEALERANALDTTTYALTNVAGPAVAGVLFVSAGPELTLLFVAGLYGIAAISLAPAVRSEGPKRVNRSSLLADAAAGLLYVLRDPSLRGLAASYSLYQVCWGVLLIAVPVYVSQNPQVIGPSESTVGLLWTISGLAGSVGALIAGRQNTLDKERYFIAGSVFAISASVLVNAFGSGVVLLAATLAVIGIFAGATDVGVLTLRQRRTDPERLGKVIAVSSSLNLAGLPVGSAIGGMVVSGSVSVAFLLSACVAFISGCLALLLIPRWMPPLSRQRAI